MHAYNMRKLLVLIEFLSILVERFDRALLTIYFCMFIYLNFFTLTLTWYVSYIIFAN